MAKFLELENVEKTARQHPETFFIPAGEERKNKKVGDSVRLHFVLKNPGRGEPIAERMWVTITQAQGLFNSYKGILENEPVFLDDLAPGDEISFKSCHIAQTVIKKDDPGWIDSADLQALVSKMCFEKNGVVRFLYREPADREEDSGWRLFTGHENDAYTEDPNNIRMVNVGCMLERDPSLLLPLKEGIGAVFEREDKDRPWKRVTDWNPAE